MLFSAWSTESSKGVVQIILLIGASMAVIDGPNIVERILGIDCGIKDGWNTITGINSAFNTIAQTSHGISKVMGSAVNGIANVGSSAVGMYNGFKEGMKPLEEQMNDKPLSNLGGFGNEDKDNKPDLKEQTSLHDEMQSQDINNGFEDISQSSNIEGDNQSSNSSNDIDSKVDSNSDINSNGAMEDNNNLEMNQDSNQNLSSQIDANNSLSNNSNTSLDNDMNKSSSSSYKNANNNQTGNNIKSSDEGHITSNENNKNDNTVANSLLENEMLSITDSSNNNSTLESEMGSQSDVSKDIGTDMSDYYSSLGTQSMDSGVGATQSNITDTSSIDKTTVKDMGSISDSKNSNIGNTIKSNSIDKGMSKQNSNTSTFNKTPNIEASINNNTSSPNLNTNPNVVNQGFAKVKSPVEHRTLSEHIKSNFQESTTFRGMKQKYSVGINTGMKMADLIRNRKNKKDK
ncbi:MAG: hypothetical protein E6538_17535 [Paeniclostridium sordellii]|nr:hypothetical protein [Paeniclostridium sordellii]